jgi:[NiFe] hydrogenase assembly HybE family chaperone
MSDAVSCLPDPSERLEAAFRAVYAEKMQGLAFVNPAVEVEAIGFAPWKHYWLGVMLTPWSMNLLLAPRDPSAWRALPPGEKRRYAFPAGTFDFISAHAGAIGEYLSCSLFSPLLEFADHATARQTAVLAREALFDSANAEVPELPAANLTPASAAADAPDPAPPLAQLEASLATPMSRRDLLHARLPRTRDEPRR